MAKERWFRLIKDVVFFLGGSPNCCYLRLCVLANLPVHALVFGCLAVEDLKVFQSFLWGFWRFWATRLPGFFFLVNQTQMDDMSRGMLVGCKILRPPHHHLLLNRHPKEAKHVTTRFFFGGPFEDSGSVCFSVCAFLKMMRIYLLKIFHISLLSKTLKIW